MAELTIRMATADDAPAIAAIYAPYVLTGTATFEMTPPDAAEMVRRMRVLREGGYPYLVVERDGVLAGYGYVGPYHARPAFRSTVENSIYLSEGARGQGIGRLLLDALVDAATRLGFRQMIAVIGDSANLPSIHLHRSAGFQEVGRLPNTGFKLGRWLDVIIMQRALGQGSSTPPGEPPPRNGSAAT